jgi:outer membrane protein OmpA-like peptidoglycan-associated protein
VNGKAIGKISAGNDILMYNAINFAYNLGGKKAIEPLYWQNPIHHSNIRMAAADPAKAIEDAFKDDDEDGVPNQLDKEADTKKGLPVDVQGRALDSDKDGLKDGDDKEPFSPPGLPIDENGVAIVPPPACCSMMDSFSRMKGMGGNGSGSGNGGSACGEVTLPSLSYNVDHYGAQRNDFVPILHIVGEKLQLCPDAKIVVSGVNDKANKNGKYNEQLSYNRANEVINFLTEKYGISRDRFIMKFNQEGTGVTTKDRRVDFKFAKDGETGESNPPAPHPGLKAGSNQ